MEDTDDTPLKFDNFNQENSNEIESKVQKSKKSKIINFFNCIDYWNYCDSSCCFQER